MTLFTDGYRTQEQVVVVVKTLSQRIADRLQYVMREHRVEQVAFDSRISSSYIYRLLKGVDQNPSIEKIERILVACGSNMAHFFEPWRNPQQELNRSKTEEERARKLLDSALADENQRMTVLALLEAFTPREQKKREHKGGQVKAVKP